MALWSGLPRGLTADPVTCGARDPTWKKAQTQSEASWNRRETVTSVRLPHGAGTRPHVPWRHQISEGLLICDFLDDLGEGRET